VFIKLEGCESARKAYGLHPLIIKYGMHANSIFSQHQICEVEKAGLKIRISVFRSVKPLITHSSKARVLRLCDSTKTSQMYLYIERPPSPKASLRKIYDFVGTSIPYFSLIRTARLS
jgi:hypothetical protein